MSLQANGKITACSSVYYNKHKNEMYLQIKLYNHFFKGFKVLIDNIKRFFRFSGYTVTVLQATLLYGLAINSSVQTGEIFKDG